MDGKDDGSLPILRVNCPIVQLALSRFSRMKFIGVSRVFDYAGLTRNSR